MNELYAEVFAQRYELSSIGLRYFNVFGRRQDPNGAYAAVIPKWIQASIRDEDICINGDGETFRDFCFVENVIQANFLAATYKSLYKNSSDIFNIAVGEHTTLNELHQLITTTLSKLRQNYVPTHPIYRDFREGDVRHSLADISKAKKLLKYSPAWKIDQGLDITIKWFIN